MAHPALPTLVASLLLLGALPAPAVTTTWLGGTGSWTDPAQWSGGVPQNSTTDTFGAAIDGGNPVSSQVTLDSAVSIDSLQVDLGDALVVTPTSQLTLEGSTIENAGAIALQGPPSSYSLVLNGDTVLSGGGSVRLEGGSIVLPSAGLFTNLDNRISGWGSIYPEGSFPFGLANYGLVEADVAGEQLDVGTGVNYGTMRAVGGGNLFLADGPNLINRGTVEALDGSRVRSSDFFDSEGGTFAALRHSTMNLSGDHSGSLFVTDADSTITLASDADHGILIDVTLDGQIYLVANVSGTITNLGSIRGPPSGGAPSGAGLYPYGPTSFVNRGQIFLGYELPSSGGGGSSAVLSFSGGGTVTINTGDQYGDDLAGPIRNLDNEMRGAGTFLQLQQNGGLIEAEGGALTIRNSASPVDHTGVFGAGLGGTLEMQATVTGSGAWRADGGLIHVTGDVATTGDIEVVRGGALAVDGAMSGGNLVVDGTSSLDVRGILRVAKDLDFDGPNSGRWFFGPSASLEIDGAGGAPIGDWSDWQSVEAEGGDLGPVVSGFTVGNFYLPELVIGPDGRLVLRDRRDNGNRSGGAREALYVDTLVFADSLGVLDLNGIDLYYNHLVGSPDQIIDVAAPEPGALLLVGLSLAMLASQAGSRRSAER